MEQFTFVRDNGQMYHADKQTVDVLRAVQSWDAEMAENVFARGRENGRIGEGPAPSLGRGHHETPSSAEQPDAAHSRRATGFEISQ
jgi:hypothetical protein